MGMIIDGHWSDDDDVIQEGRYHRQASVFDNAIPDRVVQSIIKDAGRYTLIASYSCQWSHRAMILRQVKGLSGYINLHIAHGERIQGYALDDGELWQIPGSDKRIIHLHELYCHHDPHYTGRATVPVLWDSHSQSIVSNESSKILDALDQVYHHDEAYNYQLTLSHTLHQQEAAQLDQRLYDGLSNGVYRALFAQTQEAYDEAVGDVFETLDWLEGRLETRRYLMGDHITRSDWLLFPTLARFDAIYYVQHRCCKKRLVDYTNLWAYARDLFSWQGVEETYPFEQVQKASYRKDEGDNPYGIKPIMPDVDWHAPHDRDRLSGRNVISRDGQLMNIEHLSKS